MNPTTIYSKVALFIHKTGEMYETLKHPGSKVPANVDFTQILQ
jgi:hypothetical protein